MSASEVFGLGDRAVARKTDCETSWEAADSIKDLTAIQEWVYEMYRIWEGRIDEDAYETFLALKTHVPISPSGFRSRRAELVAKGLLEFSGEYGVTKAGRRSRIWRVAQ